MFWRFGGYANISTLDQVLDKQDVTLEELLDESDLIQELKAQNAKLIDFLRDDDRLQKLLTYVVAPKSQETVAAADAAKEETKKKGFFGSASSRSKSRDTESEHEKAERQRLKYAYVACEILSSEVYSIYEALLENTESLRDFWSYIKQDAPLDPSQAGYFTKVNEALLEKKTEDMIKFIKSLDNVVADMMKHVDCPMVMDLLLKLISLEKDPEGQGIVDWLQSQNLIPMLLDYINPEHPAATQTSAGDFLKAIITISANATGQDASVIGPNELTRQLVSEDCVNRLCKEMLKGGNPLTVGVGIVIEVIRKNNSDYDSESQIGPEPKSSDPIYLGTLLRIFSHHISDFMALILSRKHSAVTEDGVKLVDRKDLKVAWGDSIEPLGFDRFKTCELMAELLHCSNMGLLNEKGSEAAIKARDVERDRLKAEGRLVAAPITQPPSQADFGNSVDSSGFHHPEDFTPLGESPEDVKRLEVQNSGDDEDFEKVAISEALPQSGATSEKPAADTDVLMQKLKDAKLDEKQEASSVTSVGSSSGDEPMHTPTSSASSKRSNVSLLSQQIQAAKDQELNKPAASDSDAPQSADVPAPLFASRSPAAEHHAVSAIEGATDNNQSDETGKGTVTSGGALTSETGEEASQTGLPVIETEDDGSPVVGDLLKMMFVEHRVVPTILDFFFRFPWNNFLHNVVYDVVQQVFNGSMDRGFNRNLAIDLFETGRITSRIIEGQERSDKAQQERKMRLGYMGHLTLIAEEVVKFTERQPPEMLAPQVIDKIVDPDWIHYVEHTLTETRDRDNAILGGVRPDASVGPRQAVLNAVQAGQFSNTGSNALANAGLSGGGGGFDSLDLANAGNTQYGGGNLLSGFGSSDDEDDEEMDDVVESEAASEGQQRTSEEDEQESVDESANGETSSSNIASIPAPLAIPPSRARRQLAARLAEKQRAANSAVAGEGGAVSALAAASGNVASLPASGTAGSGHTSTEDWNDDSAGLADHIRNAAEAQGMYGDNEHSSDEDERDAIRRDPKGGDDEMRPAPLKRQTTTEAEERRPLDVGDDDEDGDDTHAGGSSLKTWGSSQTTSLQQQEDSDSEEDQPVEMGRKSWMMRRSGSQGSFGGGG